MLGPMLLLEMRARRPPGELMLCCFARKQRCGVEAAAAPNVTYASRTHASSRASRRPTAPNRSAARSRISVLLLAA